MPNLLKTKVRMVKEAGYELNVWTVNKPARANQLANWGVDGIFTDNADKMSLLCFNQKVRGESYVSVTVNF